MCFKVGERVPDLKGRECMGCGCSGGRGEAVSEGTMRLYIAGKEQ